MSITDIVPQLQQLQHADKMRLMQILLMDIASEEGIQLAPFAPMKEIPAPSTLGQQLRAMRNQALQQGMAKLAT